MSKQLENKVVVITGGGGVLGGAFAKELARQGAAVAVLDLRLESSCKVADEINLAGGRAVGLACDVLNKASLEAAAEEVKKTLGVCDILINGAGGNHPKGTTAKETLEMADLACADKMESTFLGLTAEGFDFVLRLNCVGTFLPAQVFAKQMAGRPGATILNISSMSAFCPLTKVPAYSAAKAAVSNMTQWLAVHLADAGIRVNALAPGFFLTEQNRTLLTNADGSLTPRAEKIITHTPMKRFGRPEDLFGTLLWLVDEQASGFVNGVVIPVDGGFMAYSGV